MTAPEHTPGAAPMSEPTGALRSADDALAARWPEAQRLLAAYAAELERNAPIHDAYNAALTVSARHGDAALIALGKSPIGSSEDAADAREVALIDALDAIAEEARAATVTTFAGLLMKARMVAFSIGWTDSLKDDAGGDMPADHLRGLIQNLEALAEEEETRKDDPRQPPHGRLSPAFILLKAEREALRLAYAEAEAAMASAPENKEHETAAEAVLARIWASDDSLMATPAAVPADLGLKAHYLAAQLEEFEQLERRHCESIVADLLALFPQPTGTEPSRESSAAAAIPTAAQGGIAAMAAEREDLLARAEAAAAAVAAEDARHEAARVAAEEAQDMADDDLERCEDRILAARATTLAELAIKVACLRRYEAAGMETEPGTLPRLFEDIDSLAAGP